MQPTAQAVGRHTSIRSSPGRAKENIRDDVYRLIGLKSLLDAGRPCRHQIHTLRIFQIPPCNFSPASAINNPPRADVCGSRLLFASLVCVRHLSNQRM